MYQAQPRTLRKLVLFPLKIFLPTHVTGTVLASLALCKALMCQHFAQLKKDMKQAMGEQSARIVHPWQ